MKYAAILGLFLLAMVGCVSQLKVAGNPIAYMRPVAVHLAMDDGSCSGTVVGRHAILTAEHCIVGVHSIAVDDHPIKLVGVILDHHDHAILMVDMEFKVWASLGEAPAQGDDVFVLGNPGNLLNMFRHGYVSGHKVMRGMDTTLYDLNGFFGDSGAGLFNDKGQLVGVVSILYQQVNDGYMKVMGSFGLAFTEKQWKEAQS